MARTKTKAGEWGDLEVFESVGVRVGRPHVGIHPNGVVTFNTGFVREAKEQIGEKQYVQIYYSKANSAMVLEFTADDSLPGAMKMTGKEKAGASIGAKSFFNFYQIDIDEVKGRYIPELAAIPGKGELWVIYLGKDKALPLAERRRAGAKRG